MAARLIGGPFAGESIGIARAPRILRVYRDSRGAVRGLDQLDDRPPRDAGPIRVYVRTGDATPLTLDARTPGRFGGGYRAGAIVLQLATYRHLAEPVPPATLRDTRRWREWCTANAPRLLAPRAS